MVKLVPVSDVPNLSGFFHFVNASQREGDNTSKAAGSGSKSKGCRCDHAGCSAIFYFVFVKNLFPRLTRYGPMRARMVRLKRTIEIVLSTNTV